MSETLETKVRRIGDDVTAAWDIIRANGGVLPHKINTENLADILPQAVNINKWLAKGAFLYNYNGTFYDFYTKHEVMNMTELPPLPEGATGWPVTLAQLKTNMAAASYIIVLAEGAYTSDFTMVLNLTNSSYLSPTLFFKISGDPEDVVVRWGDGSSDLFESSGEISKQHTYASTGTYTITISVANDTRIQVGYLTSGSVRRSILSDSVNTSYASYRDYVGDIFCGTKVDLGINAFAVGYTSGSSTWWYSSVDNVVIQNFPEPELPDYMFGGAAFTKYLIPSNIRTVGISAFANCKNLEVARGSGIREISSSGFSNCSKLSQIDFPLCEKVGARAFSGCYKLEFSLNWIHQLESIGQEAFSGTGNQTQQYGTFDLVIPSDDSHIDQKAYASSSLWKTIDGRNSNKIFACNNCSALKEYKMPSSITSTLPTSLFSYCHGLEKAVIPEGVTELPYQTFYQAGGSGAQALQITLPSTLTTIRNYSLSYMGYSGNQYMDLTIPSSVTTIEGSAMNSSKINNITFEGQMPNLTGSSALVAYRKLDLSHCTSIPTIASGAVYVTSGTTVVLPDALYDQWIVSPVWSTLNCTYKKASEV